MKDKFKHQAKVLKDARIKAQLSQADVAKLFKVHPQFISNIERGANGIPDLYWNQLSKLIGPNGKNKLFQAFVKDLEDVFLSVIKD